jgi:hypothetical protein
MEIEKMKIETIWNDKDMKNHLDEFYNLYINRPIKDNDGGMKSPHMFPSWYIVKKLQPKFIIESGVWKGLGTWFFEQASPNSKIFSLDPYPHYRIYTSPNVTYLTNDFSTINFKEILDIEDTFVFFDDHQNSLSRIDQCLKFGFTKLVFEDNYPFDQGDCYSIKKVLSGKDFCIDQAGNRSYYKANPDDKTFLENNIRYYQEMPPIFKSEFTRWKNEWDYETPNSILSKEELNKYPEFITEILDYTWICYLELNKLF